MRVRQTLAFYYTVCTIIAILLTLAMPADVNASTDIGNMNALDALGIDTSKIPNGVDLNSIDNPYGRSTSTVNPVYELFVQGTSSSTLYGNNKPVGKSWDNFYSSQRDTKSNIITDSYAATTTVSGNFTKNSSGNKGQTVTVAAGTLSANGGLYMYFSNPIDDINGTAKALLNTNQTIGNTGNQMNENFSIDSYLMKNYLKIAAGDFDSDGVDEVAVYVPQQGSSRVEIYDLQIDDTWSSSNASTYYLNSAHWAKAWTYYFNESPYVSNMVSLTNGDLNHDGIDDIALTWGYYYGPDKYTNSKAVILCGSKTSMLQKSINISLNYNSSQIVRAAFSYGDIDGDNVDDLILGGQLNSDIANSNLYSRFVAIYTYNGDSDNFIQSVAKNFDLFSKDENGNYIYKVMADHHDIFYSLPTMTANIAAVNMQGAGRPSNIYIDSLIIEYGDKGLNIVAALDQNGNFNKYITTNYPDWVRNTDGRFYQEYGVVSADFTGHGSQTLQVMLNYSAEDYKTAVPYSIPYYRDWWHRLWGIKSWSTITETYTFSLNAETDMAAVQGEMTEVKDASTGTITGYDFNVNINENSVPFATSFCKLNTDNDTSFINYTGEHGVIYSDPKVLAVLASSPYFKDLSNSNGNYMQSSTSYSSTTGSGTENTTSNTLSIGAYVSYQHDFNAPITATKVAGMETELAYTHGWTWETTKSSTMEMTVSYETVVGQDSVVFYSIPMEYYVYDSYVPIIDENTGQVTGYDKQKMSVNLPHTAAVVVLTLDKYEKIAADYHQLPKISGVVLTHTIGDPSTYPTSSAGYSNVTEYNGDYAGVGYGEASITQEISVTEENNNGLTNTNTVDFKIGAGPGDLIFGISAGYEHGSGRVTISSEGSTYSGTIYNMPMEAEQYGYYFAWKLFTYTYTIGGNTFPAVNYLVKDVTEPPSLPEDFAQDSTMTTDKAIGMTWSYPSNSAISGFQIYRYYEFPDGNGSYELAFIPASEVSYITYDSNGALIRHYKYVDQNLADYTDYTYQIQAVRAAVPTSSILSEVSTNRTKADKGYPTITLGGVTANTTPVHDEKTDNVIGSVTNYSLLVYPDTSSTVSVSIAEAYDQTPRYQWQKLTDSGWADIDGASRASYTFTATGVSDEGEYRCRVNVIYEDQSVGQIYYISAYSDTFTLNYAMRTAKVVDGSFVVNVSAETVSLSLKSSHTNHTFAPSGNVTFNIKGANYNSSYTVALGGANANYETKALLDLGAVDNDGDGIFVNLPNGVYEITAYYSGSRVFDSLTIANLVYYVSGNQSGYLMNVNSSFTYGDTITPRLMSIGLTNGEVTADVVSSGVTYKVFKEQSVKKTETRTIHWWLFGNFTYKYTYIVYENVECPSFIQPDGSITARTAGSYKLLAYYGGKVVSSQNVIIAPKNITINFNYPLTGVAGNSSLSQPTYNDLKVTSINQLVSAYGDTIANLGFVVKAYNTAGTEVTISSATDPGLYTIIGAASSAPATDYSNYNITYVPSTYTLTGPKYDMTIISAPYGSDNAIVGTVSIIIPKVNSDDGNVINMTTTPTNSSWHHDDMFTGGTALILRATPQIGYQVKSWTVTTDDKTTTTNTSSTIFTYQTTANNMTITVQYQLAQNKLYFQSANNSVNDGTVTPVNNLIQSGAAVQPNASYSFLATPAEGYHFVQWTLQGSTNSNFIGNIDTKSGTSTTPLTMGTTDTILSAVFERDNYTLTLDGNLQATYMLDDGFGSMISTTKTGTITIPGDTSVKIEPKVGYSLSSDAAWYVNGTVVGTGNTSYTFIMAKNTTVGVGTNQNTYNVTVSVTQPGTTTNNVVVVKNNNVITDFSVTRPVSGGTDLVFTAAPAWGYIFDHWVVNGTTSAEASKILTVAKLGEDMTVDAVFTANPNTYTINVSNNSGGNLAYTVIYNGSGYSVNTPKNAIVTSSGTNISVYKGDTITINASPEPNYMLRSWTVGDNVDESPNTMLTLENISQNATVAARFISMSFATVNYSAESGGNIITATSNGVAFNSGDMIGNGTKIVIKAVPDIGMTVSKWTEDGKTIKTVDNTTFIDETLTIDSLKAGSTTDIKVYFTALAENTINYNLTNVIVSKTYSPDTYTGKAASTETVDHVISGTKAVITVIPVSGYRINVFTVGGLNGIENADGTWSYTINNVTSNLEVVASALKLYTVAVDNNIINGSIALATQKEEGQAVEGENVTLNSITPSLDYTFAGWSYNNTAGVGTTFSMPAENTIVSAAFTPINPVGITYSVYDVNGSEGGGTNGAISAGITRVYSNGQPVIGYPIADTDGSLTVNRGYTDSYVSWPGSIVTFTAAPDSGYMVKYWYIDGVQVTADTPNCSIGSNSLTLLAVQGSANNYNVQVQYDLIGNKITYGAADNYGAITSAVLTSQYGETINVNTGDILTISGNITFTSAPINDNYRVKSWNVNGIKQDGQTGTTFVYTAAVTAGAAITVSFERVPYTITYGGENGTVTATNNSIFIGSSPAKVTGDSIVTFTATASPGYAFSGWMVNGIANNTVTNSLSLPITTDTIVAAKFTEDANCIITYTVTGDGGTLSATKRGNQFASGSLAAANDVVTFIATPKTVATGETNNYRVASWTVNGITTASNSATYQLTVSAASTVSVTFERCDYIITYGVNGTVNGEVSASTGLTNISNLDRVETGKSITFTAKPNSGHQVKAWTVNGTAITTEDITYTITSLTSDSTIMVEFEQIPTYTITITTQGAGYGSVTAQVGNTEPNTNATTATVSRHGTVTLTAVRYDTSNAFNGWTISQNAACTTQENGMTVTLSNITGNILVNAAFTPAKMIELSASENDSHGTIDYSKVQVGYRNTNKMNTVDLSTSTSVQITSGMDVVIKAVPDSGYMVSQWLVNGKTQSELSNTLILDGVYANTAIQVTFEPIAKYSIPDSGEQSNGEYYTVAPGLKNPNDVGNGSEIRDRGTITFAVKPNDGYYFKELTIDNVDCLSQTGSINGTSQNIVSVVKGEQNSYIITVANVKNDINYTINSVKPVVTITPPTNGTIDVTYLDGSGNAQTVTTGSEVPVGTELTITATPNTGYYLSEWGGAAAGKSGTKITLSVPNKDITISSNYRANSNSGGGGMVIIGGTPAGASNSNDENEPFSTEHVQNSDGSTATLIKVTAKTTVSDNTATALVDQTMEQTLIAQIIAAENESSSKGVNTVKINAATENKVTQTKIEMSVSTISEIVNKTSATMTLSTDTAEIELDQKALTSIANQVSDDNITFSVAEVDKTTLSAEVQNTIGDAYVLNLKVSSSNGNISNFDGGTATVRVPVPKGMSGKDMNVVYIANDGTLTKVNGSPITINGVEYYEFTTGHFSYYALMESIKMPFVDVSSRTWYHDAVEYVYERGLMTGISSKTFGPNRTTTRAMLVTILWRQAGMPSAGNNRFTDVADDSWYCTAVSWAAENGIVEGIGDGLFAPDDNITREQAAVILYNYANVMSYNVSSSGNISQFTDSEEISSWAKNAIKWTVGAKLISGKDNRILDPSGTATRAEIATILMRFIENIKK